MRAAAHPIRWIVALGALAACSGTSGLLGPDAEQGIDGLVLLGPQCPVVQPNSPCPDVAYEATLDLWDAGGGYVTRLRSGADGRFHVGLRPGDYVLEPQTGNPFPYAGPVEVTVSRGEWTALTVFFDTGMR